MKFCPRCGTPLVPRLDGGRERPTCPSEGCAFTHYGDASIGTGAIVMRGDRILLIERRTPTRTWWQIPGGYVEVDEPIQEAIEREVLEESGITATMRDVVGFRHAAGTQTDWPAANIYVVFRLDAIAGEPRPDMDETFDAGFLTREEAEAKDGVSSMSLWAIETAGRAATAGGLLREAPREGLQRPGHTIFGLPLR